MRDPIPDSARTEAGVALRNLGFTSPEVDIKDLLLPSVRVKARFVDNGDTRIAVTLKFPAHGSTMCRGLGEVLLPWQATDREVLAVALALVTFAR